MPSKTISVTNGDGSTRTITIPDRSRFAGVRNISRNDGTTLTVNRTAPVITSDRKGESRPLLSKLVGGAAAAYSLRDLNDRNGNNKVVRVRRESDNSERDFRAKDINNGELVNWVNGKLETTLPADLPESIGDLDITEFTLNNVTATANGSYTSASPSSIWNGPNGARFSKDSNNRWQLIDDGRIRFRASTTAFVSRPWLVASWNEVFGGQDVLPSIDNGGFSDFVGKANTPAAAYSLRKVRNDYTGNAVKIRRASDNVEVNVAFDSNDKVSDSSTISNVTESPDQGDTTATTLGEFLTEGGNQDATVVTWYDQSVNGYDATQPTTGSQPKIAENGSLLTDGISFETAQTHHLKVIGTSDETLHTFAVYNARTASPEFGPIFDASGSNASSQLYSIYTGASNNQTIFRFRDLFRIKTITKTSTDGSKNLATALFEDSTNIGYFGIDGETPSSISGFSLRRTSNLWGIGASYNAFTGRSFDGTISELIIYNTDQSDNRFKIESNLNNYYGIYTAAEDGFVETWYDQSGKGNDATQLVAAEQPKIVGEITSGQPHGLLDGVDFDGASAYFELDSEINLQDNSAIFSALTTSESSNTAGFLNRSNNAQGININANGFFSRAVGSGNSGSFLFSNNTSEKLVSSLVLSESVTAFQNGAASVDNPKPETLSSNSPNQIGGNGNGSNYWTGQIQEIIIYESDQSANRAAIEANINNHYDIF